MTIEFLMQGGLAKLETTHKLAAMLTMDADRIYLLTGSISANAGAQSQFSQILKWVHAKESRELVVLVGVFGKLDSNQAWKDGDGQKEAETLAKLTSETLRNLSGPTIKLDQLNIRFYAIHKWHAKAIGITGAHTKFRHATAAIFGSTNFTESALGGLNFELDTYIDNKGPDGEKIKLFAAKLADLIQTARSAQELKGFHEMVMRKIEILGGSTAALPTTDQVNLQDDF